MNVQGSTDVSWSQQSTSQDLEECILKLIPTPSFQGLRDSSSSWHMLVFDQYFVTNDPKKNMPKTVSKVAAPLSKRSWLAGWALRPLGSYEVHSFLLPTQIATTKRKALPLCGGQTLWTKNALIHWYRYIAHIFVVFCCQI